MSIEMAECPWRSFLTLLFLPQGDQRIEGGGPARRKIAGDHGQRDEQQRNPSVSARFPVLQPKISAIWAEAAASTREMP